MKHVKISLFFVVVGTIFGYSQTTDSLVIDSLPVDSNVIDQNEVLVTGTHSKGRTQMSTAVPVDILNIKELTASAPQVSLNQILNYAIPSFNSNTQAGADGTDHIDPSTLRGLGPDQVLVLVNGKRFHSTSLVNVNGTIGRGSTGTDMNAIPTSAIERIEILRDGAAAQYGSDAIAGVINIVLRKDTNELNATVNAGANFTKNHGEQKDVDGETYTVGLNYGIKLGEKGGFINFTGEFEKRGWTDRNSDFKDPIFNGYNAVERVAKANGDDLVALQTDVALIQKNALGVSYFSSDLQNSIANATTINELQPLLKGDVTNDELSARGENRADYNLRFGQSALRGGKFFFNSVVPVSENAELYSFGGLSMRKGEATAFYRLPNAANSFTPTTIDGYLPIIGSTIKDQSLTVGIRGKINEWDVDFSNTYGKNSFDFDISNTKNASLQNATPLSFSAGGYEFTQNTVNLDARKKYNYLQGYNLAIGSEFRYEQYAMNAGEEASYTRYDVNGNPVNSATANDLIVRDFFGAARPGGSQGFSGIRDKDAKGKNRNSIAFYIDNELDITKKWLLTGALRFENYSDFGSVLNFKLSSRFKVTEQIAIRGAINTGFRAPSLHQIFYSQQNTFYNTATGAVQETGIYANDSREAQAFGIPKLKEEKSISYSLGSTAKVPSLNLKLTLDGYYIKIKDRVNLTESITSSDITNQEAKDIFTDLGVDAVAFFANTVDTETMGLDFIVEQKARLGSKVTLNSILSATFSKTNALDVHIPESFETAPSKYFSNRSELILEDGAPNVKANLLNVLSYNKWTLFLRNAYFGEVKELSTRTNFTRPDGSTIDNTYDPRIVTDLSLGYQFSKALNLTAGANNIFDVYPEKTDAEFSTAGRFPYSRNTQFGFGGRYLFAKLTFKLK